MRKSRSADTSKRLGARIQSVTEIEGGFRIRMVSVGVV
jgi:hypothetical protein